MEAINQQIDNRPNISYNLFLFTKRKEEKVNRMKFAKKLHIPYFRYVMIENGYLKPKGKDLENINEYFGFDFEYYLEESRGYPTEIPEKNPSRLVVFLYRVLGSKITKIILTVFAVLFATTALVGTIGLDKVDEDQEKYYGPTVLAIRDGIIEKGSTNFSLLDDLTYPQISQTIVDEEEHTEKLIQIRTKNDTESFTLSFIEVYWSDTSRYFFSFENYLDGAFEYSFESFDYETNQMIHGGFIAFGSLLLFNNEDLPEKVSNEISTIFEKNDFCEDFAWLINLKLGIDVDFAEDVALPLNNGKSISDTMGIIFALMHLGGVIFLALSIFGLAYAFIYGYKKDEINIFRHGDDLLLDKVEPKPFKKDFKLTPFLPETFMEILGIVFVAIGSYRIVVLSSLIGNFSTDSLNLANGNLLTMQMLGMFLLYFIDFDLFMDDKRVLRNIVMYALLFIVLYYIEAGILSAITSQQNALALAVPYLLIPNPFGSVGCYFGIMAFLYFTPKFIKTKKGLIIYRSCAILPIIYLVVAFLLFNGDTFFGMDVSNYWFRYFFNSERVAFSALAVGYLVGLYFLRLFFKIKYGEEGGSRFINGNRFIFYKNILISAIVIVVWVIDLFFIGNTSANKMGIGVNGLLIILVPFLLFYHPHKGPRNMAVDGLTQVLYFLSMAYAYVLALFVALIGLLI